MPTEEQRQKFEKIKAEKESKSTAGQGFQNDRTATTQEPTKGNELVAHQAFEHVAQSITQLSENRLNSLTGAVIESRKQQVDKHLDILAQVESGEVDAFFLTQGLMERRQARKEAPQTFEVQVADQTINPNFKELLEANLDAQRILNGYQPHPALKQA